MSAADGIQAKIGITFEKEGWSRFYSHHDLIRFFERAFARTGLAVRKTQGFNPKPRLVFPAPLSLGTASKNEHLEVEFDDPVTPDEVENALKPFMLPGMQLTGATNLPKHKKGRQVTRCGYRMQGWNQEYQELLKSRVSTLSSTVSLPLKRRAKSGETSLVDIAPSIEGIQLDSGGITLIIRECLGATARPREIAAILCDGTVHSPDSIFITRIKTEVV